MGAFIVEGGVDEDGFIELDDLGFEFDDVHMLEDLEK